MDDKVKKLMSETDILENLNISERSYKRAVEYLESFQTGNPWKELELYLAGEPKAWNRAIKTRTHYYDPNVGFKAQLLNAVMDQLDDNFKPIAGPMEVDITFYRMIPKGMPAYKKVLCEAGHIGLSKKPDADNLAKNFQDAMNGYLFVDDSQITDITIRKRYSVNPRIEVKIKYMEKSIL